MPYSGSLLVNAYETNIGKPLDGVVVRIINSGSGKVLEELKTNASGNSDILNLVCPPRDYSLDFVYGWPKPYAQYNLDITAHGFQPQRINGVEIMDGTTSIQNIFLTPAPLWDSQIKAVTIKEHALYADYPPKIAEEDTKPLPPPTGHIVLDKPVIPETIVVHDGLPDNKSAKNYYVPFKDYIKNVASSEIYSTWPVATIKANVLAIISFALNRVFTEWYKGQGKDFTITSSTAYDHAFSYGRNIFQEISVVVDELFATYVTKPHIRQPLFTQYCDGKRSSCPQWMSQWGSKDLGDKGYGHIEILKNYYGHDIYTENAEKVSGVPSSFPGSKQGIGSSGNSVRTIQEQLNAISKNYPEIKKVKEDGIYGNDTASSVKTFQKIFSLPQTGIVDFATWYKISHVYVAVLKLAELV